MGSHQPPFRSPAPRPAAHTLWSPPCGTKEGKPVDFRSIFPQVSTSSRPASCGAGGPARPTCPRSLRPLHELRSTSSSTGAHNPVDDADASFGRAPTVRHLLPDPQSAGRARRPLDDTPRPARAAVGHGEHGDEHRRRLCRGRPLRRLGSPGDERCSNSSGVRPTPCWSPPELLERSVPPPRTAPSCSPPTVAAAGRSSSAGARVASLRLPGGPPAAHGRGADTAGAAPGDADTAGVPAGVELRGVGGDGVDLARALRCCTTTEWRWCCAKAGRACWASCTASI